VYSARVYVSRERVHVYVDDANEFDPVWRNTTYVATVEEGVSRKEIIEVKATDGDGSPGLSKICQYHVMNQDVPFDIDENGKENEILCSYIIVFNSKLFMFS